MPIFNNEITFIHIPKTGGTSIEKFLQSKGYKMTMWVPNPSVLINGHTPQHSTYKELESLNLLTDKIFTVVRPEAERCVSEYYYLKKWKTKASGLFTNFDEFLDLFLNKDNYQLFDYHNMPNKDFITNKLGEIDNRIKIIDFFNIKEIEDYLQESGLSNFHELKSSEGVPFQLLLSSEQHQRILDFYQR